MLVKKIKYLLLSGMLVSVGLWAKPGAAQVSNTQLNAFVEALRISAPPQSPNDGMYSDWQVLPGIIGSWTKQCVGEAMTPQQFDSDRSAARRTVTCIMRRELNKQLSAPNNDETSAVRRAACWWMTGEYTGCSSGETATYVNKVVNAYKQQISAKK